MKYIGITDFMNAEQSRAMLKVMEECGATRHLMVGVMMSHKTLNGLPTKWASAFPKKEDIASIFVEHPLAYNTLHYADYEGQTKTEDLNRAAGFCGEDLHAVQFDMPWPAVGMLGEFFWGAEGLGPDLIIQIGKLAFEQEWNDSVRICRRIEEYQCEIPLDCVLLDKSMGQGKGMDAGFLLPFVREIAKNFPDLGIAVAGGLGPKSMHLVEPIAKEFPRVSIDAQGRLRPSGSALDPIDWSMAEEYLRKANELLA